MELLVELASLQVGLFAPASFLFLVFRFFPRGTLSACVVAHLDLLLACSAMVCESCACVCVRVCVGASFSLSLCAVSVRVCGLLLCAGRRRLLFLTRQSRAQTAASTPLSTSSSRALSARSRTLPLSWTSASVKSFTGVYAHGLQLCCVGVEA